MLLAAVALAVIGGVVAADGGDPPPPGESADADAPNTDLIAEVAENLGVDAAALENAYRQAREESLAEKQQEWLDALVEKGSLTEDEVVAMAAWLDAMPDAFDSVPFGLGLGRIPALAIGPLSLVGDGTCALHTRVAEILGVDAEAFEQALQDAQADLRTARFDEHLHEMLDRLAEDGTLTTDEAADLRQWLEERPAAVDKLRQGGPLGILRSGCRGMGFGFSFERMLPHLDDRALPRGGLFRGKGHFDHGKKWDKAFEAFGNGFNFEFGDEGIEIMPGRGFGQFKRLGPGGSFKFKFHLPSVEEQVPVPTPAPAEGTAGESA